MALTKVTGHVIKSDTNITSHNINSSGIITAISFDGNVSGVAVTFTGDSTIGSLGITTNLTVGGNIDVDGHTELDNVNVAGVTTFNEDISFKGANFDFLYDRSLNTLKFDQGIAAFGTSGQMTLQNQIIRGVTNIKAGGLYIQNLSNQQMISCYTGGQIELYYNNSKKFNTTNTGASVTGNLAVSGNMNVEGVLTYQDVTNIDSIGIVTARSDIRGGRNLNVTGISTFAGDVKVGSGITFHATNSRISLPDGTTGSPYTGNLELGNNRDFTIVHDSNHTYMVNRTGDFYIGISDSVFPIRLKSNNTAELYHGSTKVLETTSSAVLLPDRSTNTGRIAFGDLGTRIEGGGGGGADDGLYFMTNSVMKWQMNPDGDLIPNTAGAVDIGSASKEIGDVFLADDKSVQLGNSQDLKIFHDSTNSQIHNVTGTLRIRGDSVKINNAGASKNAIVCESNIVTLYYDNSARLATNDNGISVTGEVAASQDYPNFRPTLDFNFAAEKKLDPRITYQRTGPASFTDEFGKVVLVGDNTPRFDHDPATRESKGLLLEESRTNKVLNSETLATGWSLNNSATRYKDDIVAPDGVLYTNTSTGGSGVWEVVETSSSTTHLVYQQLSGGDSPNSTACTISAFAKPGLNRTHFVLTEGNTLSATAIFDVANGTVTSTVGTGSPSARIEGPYHNGWYRCSLTYTTASTQNYINIQLGVAQNGTTVSYAGDGSSSIAVWGIQHEVGAFSTSYIRSMDGSATTRGADLCQITGEDFSDFYNQDEGTIVSEHSIATGVASGDNTYVYQVDDGSDTNVAFRLLDHNGAHGDVLRAYGFLNGSWNSPLYGAQESTPNHDSSLKVAVGIKKDDFGVNFFGQGHDFGTGTYTDTSGDINVDMTQLTLGNHRGGTAPLQGYLRRFIYYPQKLTTNQLKTITS